MFGHVEIEDQEITDEQLEASKADTDTAIYVVARNSGEGADRTAEPGDYYLTDVEKANIQKLAENFDKCIVVLNQYRVILDTLGSRYNHLTSWTCLLYTSRCV